MQAYKWVAGFILVVILGVGGFSMAVAAATGPLAVPNEPATLHIESSGVQIEHAGSADWSTGTEGMTVIPGDSLKTDSTGSGSVNLFDQGEVRLDHDTQITLTQALWDEKNPDVFLGSIFLSTGRLWSRLFDFVSPDSGFNVRTSSTVATVRGTVFSVTATADGGAWVYVDDHTVNVKTPTDSLAPTSGQHAQVAQEIGRFAITRQEMPAGFSDWISKNRVKDAAFDKEVRARWKAKLLKSITFTRIAEALRLTAAFNADTKAALKTRFALRAKLLGRLVTAKHDDLPPAPSAEAQPATETITSTGSITIEGLPGGTQVIPLNTQTITSTTPSQPAPSSTTTPPPPSEPVAPAAYPTSLLVTCKYNTVATGSQTSLTATLVFSDDHTEDVSKDVNWEVLPDANGYTAGDMISNIFVAGSRGSLAYIKATYTGATQRFQADLTLTVEAPAGTIAPLQ